MKNSTFQTHIFTSCTNCYIPKARVLGKSIKKFHPEIKFHLVLSDILPQSIILEDEPFDSIISIEELNIPNLKQWIFKHSVVEMCTAIKGVAFQEIFKRYNCEQVIFLDPDIAIFSRLDELFQHFEESSILLTPHQLEPEKSRETVIDNEICFLMHGVFNLGFLGVKNSLEGTRFLEWWSHRCLNFCYADTASGLYTDQRWIDLVPSFFTQVAILRNPAYNVAYWNLTNREVTGSLEEGIFVNGKPLCFYHFSSSQVIMQEKYRVVNLVTASLLEWYQQQCEQMGQVQFMTQPCFYDFFDNGVPISYQLRIRYRHDQQLQNIFPQPFETSNPEKSILHWYHLDELNKYEESDKLKQELDKHKQESDKLKQQSDQLKRESDQLKQELQRNLALIEGMESSKFWKIRSGWFTLKKMLGIKVDD